MPSSTLRLRLPVPSRVNGWFVVGVMGLAVGPMDLVCHGIASAADATVLRVASEGNGRRGSQDGFDLNGLGVRPRERPWATSPAALAAAFRPDSDAPGMDEDGIPREPGSRRMLSVSSGAFRVAVYASPARSVEAAAAFYGRSLAAEGWTLDTPATRGRITARRGGRVVVVSFTTDDDRVLIGVAAL